jgi:predicted nucleotidyltransferase
MKNKLNLPESQKLSDICKKYHIRQLSLFGSALRAEFQSDSDIDLLVEFDHAHIPGFFKLAEIEREFSTLFSKRRVDLRTPEDLSRYFRQDVLDYAEPLYSNL